MRSALRLTPNLVGRLIYPGHRLWRKCVRLGTGVLQAANKESEGNQQ